MLASRLLPLLGFLVCATSCREPARPPPARLRVVLSAEAGDDASAVLAMLLEARRKPYVLAELMPMLHASGHEKANALEVVETAKRLGLPLRGVQLRNAAELQLLDGPCIAHLLEDEGPFPRDLKTMGPGRFVIIEAVMAQSLSIIDPSRGGRIELPIERFTKTASGVVLLAD